MKGEKLKMQAQSGRGAGSRAGRVALAAVLVVMLAGCSRESLRSAIEAQQRADQVQQAVFEKQHDGLRVLLYRDLVRRLDSGEEPLSEAQLAALNEAWNQRDLMEFWAIQNERARALRLAGVDAKLYGDQSPADLIAKQLEAKGQRAKQAAAAQAGKEVGRGKQ